MHRWAAAILCGIVSAGASAAQAQSFDGPSFYLEAASDERRRGLSWSEGDPIVRGGLSLPVTHDLTLDTNISTLSDGKRHGDAAVVIDLRAAYARQIGAWRLAAEGSYHAFPGASGQGYGELGLTGGILLGPASLDLLAQYAPRQAAIGGDNLYLGAKLGVGIPGTPLTLSGHAGHSSGDTRNAIRAARLRPNGSYWDHGVALNYHKGLWTAGLGYANSSIDRAADRHAGATVIGRFGIAF
ncbi:TorF family putative porin [Sphingobium phenoxybenzoativorans]|uniref:TorF family putative porin n=1 Tax=Sphingobium phenoxybenzoativorans TaxID=1592790 RepID=UPI0008732E5C|nr:TorF family putative porin [Sphingobium phenoxybenzoativorans]